MCSYFSTFIQKNINIEPERFLQSKYLSFKNSNNKVENQAYNVHLSNAETTNQLLVTLNELLKKLVVLLEKNT